MEVVQKREAWNKGKLIGQKPPLKLRDIWAIRIHFQNRHAVRDLAMFNLDIDSKLRGCDLVSMHVRDVIQLHPALRTAFSSLYGYTSDEGGIRHALMEPENIRFEDAKFFLVVCSAFINFVEAKIANPVG